MHVYRYVYVCAYIYIYIYCNPLLNNLQGVLKEGEGEEEADAVNTDKNTRLRSICSVEQPN